MPSTGGAVGEKADEIERPLNFSKNVLLTHGPCTTTMYIVYKWLYNWNEPSDIPLENRPMYLTKHLDESPDYGKNFFDKKLQKNRDRLLNEFFRQPLELTKLTTMSQTPDVMASFDVTFYFKLIQFGTNSPKLAFPGAKVWSSEYSPKQPGEPEPLEYLLYKIKDERNDMGHKSPSLCNVDEESLRKYCQNLYKRLESIVKLAGEKSDRKDPEIDAICAKLKNEIENIQYQTDFEDKKMVLKYVNDMDYRRYISGLDSFFHTELRAYTQPLLNNKDKDINFEDIFVKSDTDIVILSANAGCGKTTLSKYIKYSWLKGNTDAIDGLGDFDLVIRMFLGTTGSKDVSKFLQDEFALRREHMSTTSSMKKTFECFKILWILDGYDEATADGQSFLKNLLLVNFSKDHKAIITTRSDCVPELENIIGKANVTKVTITNFDGTQIKAIAEKYLKDTDIADFIEFYDRVNEESQTFMKKAINLKLCLDLWSSGSITLTKTLDTHHLYMELFEIEKKNLVERFKKDKNKYDEATLRRNIEQWFYNNLCKAAASCVSGNWVLNKSLEHELIKAALDYGLTEMNYCMSTFFHSEESFAGIDYSFKHLIQQEILGVMYVKQCLEMKRDKLIYEMLQTTKRSPHFYQNTTLKPYKVLFLCCNSSQFAFIFEVCLNLFSGLQCPEIWMDIKCANEDFFYALRDKIAFDKSVLDLHVNDDIGVGGLETLKDSLKYLSPEVKNFHLIITNRRGSSSDFYSELNLIVKELNDISVKLTLRMASNSFIPIIETFNSENDTFIKEILLDSSVVIDPNDPVAVEKRLSSMGKVGKICFGVTDSFYPSSFLRHLALHCSTSLLQSSCHLHFIIEGVRIYKLEVIRDLIEISNYGYEVSVEFTFNLGDRTSSIIDSEKQLLSQFISSNIKVIKCDMVASGVEEDCHKDFHWFQLVNCENIETYWFPMYYTILQDDQRKPIPVEIVEEILCNWKFSKQNKITELLFSIFNLQQLTCLYENLSSEILAKCSVRMIPEETDYVTGDEEIYLDIPEYDDKQIMHLEIEARFSLRMLTDFESYELFKNISKSLLIRTTHI